MNGFRAIADPSLANQAILFNCQLEPNYTETHWGGTGAKIPLLF
jgi:hypothetical protein